MDDPVTSLLDLRLDLGRAPDAVAVVEEVLGATWARCSSLPRGSPA